MRKPKYYIRKRELTDEQVQRFVDDCVESGATDEGDAFSPKYTLVRLSSGGGIVGGINESWVNLPATNDVTDQYKQDSLDLPTLLRECAEHLEAGRDPCDYYTRNGRFETGQPVNISQILTLAETGSIVRKPKTVTINVEVPAPMMEEHKEGQEYWYISAMGAERCFPGIWSSHPLDRQLMDKKLFKMSIWRTKEEAQQAADAIFGALKGES